jgi:transcriptional regulator with XRE-family HTH domain
VAPNQAREIREQRAQIVPAAFTISAVARRVGVTEAALRRWENGTARPRKRHARALARELGVRVDDLGFDPVEADEDASGS